MTQVPEGAQRSEDGNYWWDGTEWQLIPEDQRSADPAAAAPATSDDPLQNAQVRQAVSHDYPEIAAYDESHGAELGTEPEESQEA